MNAEAPLTTEKRLTPEVKAKWLEALRSGKYCQGRDKLHRLSDNTYCCLGVLQAVNYVPKSLAGELLDGQIAGDLGLPVQVQQHLAHLNDNGSSFEEIAAYIEAHL